MTTGYKSNFFVTWRRCSIPTIVFSLILGLHTGILLCVRSGPTFFSLMHNVASESMSLVGCLSLGLIPLLVCAVCIHLGAGCIIPIVLWAKGLSFGFVSCLAFRAFGSAGWLIHFLLFSLRQIQLIILILFCIRFCCQEEVPGFRYIFPYFAASAALCVADYLIIAPFLAEII